MRLILQMKKRMMRKKYNTTFNEYRKLSELFVFIFLFFFSVSFANVNNVDNSFSADSISLQYNSPSCQFNYVNGLYVSDSTIIFGLSNIHSSEEFIKRKTYYCLEKAKKKKKPALTVSNRNCNELKRKKYLKKQTLSDYSYQNKFQSNIFAKNTRRDQAVLLPSKYEYPSYFLYLKKSIFLLFKYAVILSSNYYSKEFYNSAWLKRLGSRAPPVLIQTIANT